MCEGKGDVLQLPEPDLLPDREINFLELIELRASRRQYTAEALSLQELSYLLWCTQGVKMVAEGGRTLRNVPSAAALHPLTTLLYLQNAEDVPTDFYQFMPVEHALKRLTLSEDAPEEMLAAFEQQARHSHVRAQGLRVHLSRCRSYRAESLSDGSGTGFGRVRRRSIR